MRSRVVTVSLACVLSCCVVDAPADEPLDADTIEVRLNDGRVLTFSAEEVRAITYVARESARAAELPVTRKHVLIQLDESLTAEAERADVGSVTVSQDDIESTEWQQAIADAKKHQGGRGHYTLFRVVLEDGAPADRVQIAGSKLKKLTAKYDGGGGRYRVEPSGAFVLLQHINGSSRRDGKDPLEIGSMEYGQGKLWIRVPEFGTLGVLGDVVVPWPTDEERGELRIEVLPNDIKQARTLRMGPVVVGGRYGESLPIEDGECRVSDLGAGTYKLLLPDFEIRASRWDVKIAPGMVTHLQFEVRSEEQIVKVTESFEPLSDD